MEKNDIKKTIIERYSEIVTKGQIGCGCSADSSKKISENLGYNKKDLEGLPQEADFGLGCGNPTAMADIKQGEIVVDLGSGAGIDAFIASKKVGPAGKVVGIDMTPEMIRKARENARKNNYHNVEFVLGEIENLPISDNFADVVLSNCVINLSTDKYQVFSEAYRVLKPNGRMIISDLVTNIQLPLDLKNSLQQWAGCIAGTMEKNQYLDIIKKSGFIYEILDEKIFYDETMDKRLENNIVSLKILLVKK